MIETKRLLIRPAQAHDTSPMFEVYGDPETMRYWDTLPDAEREQTERRIIGMMQQKRPSYFIIEHNARAIGAAGIHSGDEIGFILHRAYWRTGIMRECLGALIPWCFNICIRAASTVPAEISFTDHGGRNA